MRWAPSGRQLALSHLRGEPCAQRAPGRERRGSFRAASRSVVLDSVFLNTAAALAVSAPCLEAMRGVGRRAGRLQASAAESGNSWKRSAGLPCYPKLWSGCVAVIDAFKRPLSQRSPVYGAASRLASVLHAASSSAPGQRCSSAVSADVRIAGARNYSQIMLTLPNGAVPRTARAR